MSAPPRRAAATPTSSGFLDASEMDKYRLVSNIGKGSFGVISKIQRIEDGKEFAMKQLDYAKMNEKDRKQMLAEVAILESLRHRNIVQLVAKIRDPKNERIFIIMEYCTSGDLGSLIRKAQRTGSHINEDKIWNIFLQITLALHHCHWPSERKPAPKSGAMDGRTQVLHRDLKPENVFLSGEFVKLGDFGLSKDMAGSMFTQTYVGTPLYMPPEILAENRYDTKSDIWSLGCLVFEMCTLHSPFSNARTQEELIAMVKSGKLPPLPNTISPSLKMVVKAMLTLNPVRRPSTKDLLEMDEMKLHRKLFTVQQQISTLSYRRDEIERREERVRERLAALETREQAVAEREAGLAAHEAALAAKEVELSHREAYLQQGEEMLRDNHQRIMVSEETLKQKWGQLRAERDLVQGDVERPQSAPLELRLESRPPLEERKTQPVPLSHQRHAAYADTPSKIPFSTAYASPAPLDSRLASKISVAPSRRGSASLSRRLASKSLSNLAQRAREDSQSPISSGSSAAVATPSKQRSPYRPGRASVGSPGELVHREKLYDDGDITMRTATSFASPAPTIGSVPSSPFIPRPRGEERELPGAPPTLIPAPRFVYRPEATPAKWDPHSEDLPSPFLRRASSAASTGPTSITGALASAAIPASSYPQDDHPRAPLGAINLQPTASAPSSVSSSSGQPRKLPRSRSGVSLHQQVLRTAAARDMGAPVRTRVGRDPARC